MRHAVLLLAALTAGACARRLPPDRSAPTRSTPGPNRRAAPEPHAKAVLPALRSALYLLWLVATVVPWALAVLVASIFIRGDPLYWMCVGWCRVAIWGARTICGVRWRIGGMEQLPRADQTAPMLLAPKHQSTWETLALPTLMPHPLCYVFKRELLLIPFFGSGSPHRGWSPSPGRCSCRCPAGHRAWPSTGRP